MRGGDDVGSRMRVAAAACLVSSGLFVGGASGAVALAEPDSGGDATSAGSPGRTANDRTAQPRRTAPRGVGTVTGARTGSAGPRSAVPPARTTVPAEPSPADPATDPSDIGEADPSKLSGPETEVGAAPSGDGSGEPDAITAGADEDDEEDDECGWGWWPLPPDTASSAPNGGDGYGGGVPTAQLPDGRPGVPPGIDIPPRELLPESPVLPVVPDLAGPLPILVLPPVVPGIAGGASDPEPSTPAPKSPQPPAPVRVMPAERPAVPRAGDGEVVAASYRAGYGEYLRTADMSQLVAVAVPGATGIMLLTGAGGFLGYRQARAGLAIRARGSARFSS